MPYKNPNYCLSEKYFAQKDQEALAAKYNMMNGMYRVLASELENDPDLEGNLGEVAMDPDLASLAGSTLTGVATEYTWSMPLVTVNDGIDTRDVESTNRWLGELLDTN
jgi:hypothetical protein